MIHLLVIKQINSNGKTIFTKTEKIETQHHEDIIDSKTVWICQYIGTVSKDSLITVVFSNDLNIRLTQELGRHY